MSGGDAKAAKVLGALSLCRKAGALAPGFDAARAAVEQNPRALVLFAEDLSPKSRQRLEGAGAKNTRTLPLTMDALAAVAKKPTGIFAVTKHDLAALCLSALDGGGKGAGDEEETV